jgi:hypothetical protein
MGMEILQAISDLRIFSNFYECAETSIRFSHPTLTDCGFGLTLTRGEGSDPGTSSIATLLHEGRRACRGFLISAD